MANQHPPKLPFSFAKQQGVCVAPEALQKLKDKLTVVHPKPVSPHVLAELRRFLGQPFQLEQVDEETFTQCLTKAYEAQASRAQEVMLGMEESMDLDTLVHELPKAQDLLESENDAPIIKLLNAVFTQAIKQNASDIHVETFEQRLLVRFRVDGVLREVLEPPRVLAPLIISRLKVMAKLDIAEKRLPQDGRITLRLAGRLVDVRVSTLPSSHGERVVLRLLDKQTAQLNLSHLGLSETALTTLDGLIHKPHGIILVTGPTGSGKTTTLYAALTVLNETRRNILTIEDPIEYYLEGIGQTQVNPKVDMTFARGLRAILRQDPDVVMIGEIRDLETAEIAVQASLTGHLVLSTLHTNSAIGAITRLRDMGVEPFLLSSTLIGVAAQRLVRVLCTSCKHATPATAEQCQQLGIPLDTKAPATLYEPRGCDDCNQTGFRGRTGIYEIIPVDSTLSAMIHNQASEADMEAHARASVPSIRQDGWRKVLEDVTTIEEVLQVTA